MSSSWRIVEPDVTTRTVEFTQDRITLGRSTKSDFSFQNDTSLSRKHLSLECKDQVWQLHDLDSMNGTRINGVEVLGRHPVPASIASSRKKPIPPGIAPLSPSESAFGLLYGVEWLMGADQLAGKTAG